MYCFLPECTSRQDVVFLLDASGSVEDTFLLIQDLTVQIIQGLNFAHNRTRVGLVTFSRNPTIRFHLKDIRPRYVITTSIAYTLEDTGETNLAAALQVLPEEMFTRDSGDRRGVEDVAILITDGKATRRRRDIPAVVEQVRGQGIRVITVGVHDADDEALRNIASSPTNQHMYELSNQSETFDVAEAILDMICDL